KSGQHHNSDLSSSKPRGHETSRGVNRPNRSQEITTGGYKKPETYRRQAAEHSGNTSDERAQAANREPWNDDIRDQPDTTTGSTRARQLAARPQRQRLERGHGNARTLKMPSEHAFRPGEQHPEAWRKDL